MNRKQFLILLALVVVIGAAGLLVHRNSNDSWHAGGGVAVGQKLLPDFPVNDIAQITIKSGAGELNLARQNNLWCVRERGNYPANFPQLSELLLKLADLKIVQSDEVGPSQLGRFQLLPPGTAPDTGTSVEFKDQNGKTLDSLVLGKQHLRKPVANSQPAGMGDDAWPDGRYVLVGANSQTVAVISDPLDNVQPKPEQWLSKDFLSIEKPRTIAVQFPEATNSWKLTRNSESDDWQLADARPGEKLDSTKISSVTSPFASVNFSDVSPLSAGVPAANIVLTAETFDGFTYVSKIGPKQGDNYPVTFSLTANLPLVRTPAKDEKPDDKTRLDAEFQARQKTLADKLAKESAYTNWVYQVPAYGLDEMLKTRPQLLDTGTNSVAESPK